MDIIRIPLTEDEMKLRMNEFFQLQGVVSVDLQEFLTHDEQNILELFSLKMVGHTQLQIINYFIVGHEGNTLFIEVYAVIPEFLVVEYTR